MRKKSPQKKCPPKQQNLPVYCDFNCAYSSFASPEAVGACRRDQAVYCTLLDTYNMKHSMCLVRKQGNMRK
jgi:hypothetical protein